MRSVPSQNSQLRLRSTQQSQGLGRVPHQPTNTGTYSAFGGHFGQGLWTVLLGWKYAGLRLEMWDLSSSFQFPIVSMGWYASRDQGGYLLLDATSYVQLYMIAVGRKFFQKKSFQTLLKSLDLIK